MDKDKILNRGGFPPIKNCEVKPAEKPEKSEKEEVESATETE